MNVIHLNRAWQRFRDRLFRPIVRLLDDLGISASLLTNFRFALVILFLYSFYYNPLLSIIILTFEIFLDLLDGPLARYSNQHSDRGHFMDLLVDSIVYILIVFTFFNYSANFELITANIVLVNYVFLLATIKKNEMEKTDWIINPYPRSAYLWYPAIIAFYAFHLFDIDYLELSLWVSNLVSVILFFYYYITIQTRWSRLHKQ